MQGTELIAAAEIAIAKYDTIEKIVEQLLMPGYHDDIGHQLKNNIAFTALQRMANKPIDMILPCPACGTLHVDAPEPDICGCGCVRREHRPCGDVGDLWCDNCGTDCTRFKIAWDNPPHKTHLCHGCGIKWRPADVPTNGVAEIKTRGENDTWPEVAQ